LRLRRSSEFARVRKEGTSVRAKFLRLSVLAVGGDEPLPESKVGIITSRQVGGAVLRVRVRRLLRELHRLSRPDLRQGLWIVMIAQREASAASLEDLRREWLRLGHKLSIFRPA
jgi:ribonuclease P protein component